MLSIGFLLGQVTFMIFGPTGRDVVYGLMIIVVVGGGIAAAVAGA